MTTWNTVAILIPYCYKHHVIKILLIECIIVLFSVLVAFGDMNVAIFFVQSEFCSINVEMELCDEILLHWLMCNCLL